ncbi:MAG: outer membrane protein transport protein [Bacteroidetes bacterium]|nr:outer membrane protein transport protein [Bacteroidota bacterium]
MKRAIYLSILITVAAATTSPAQTIQDALRLSQPATLFTPRSAGMGNAFVGLANDASALYWNPAGLGQLRQKEFSLGLSNIGFDNDASMFGVSTNGNESSTTLTHLNLAIPFPVVRGSFVMSAGYNRLLDFTGAMALDVYNPQSSIQSSLFNDDPELDFAWNLGLEDTLVLSYIDENQPGWLAVPVANRVQQTIDVTEEGSLNQWSFGGSMEVARNIMVGAALNVLTGSYRYERTFIEDDINNVWQDVIIGIPSVDDGPYVARTDFQRLELLEEIEQDISGWNMKFGFLYNYQDKARFGVSIQTASYISINEDYYKAGDSYFADASLGYDLVFENHNYEISTSPIYSFGASWSPVEFATVSADFEIVDFSDIEFEDSNDWDPILISDYNRNIRNTFRSANNFRIGAEFMIPNTGLFLRGGFGYRYSAYEVDENTTDFDVKTLSGGVGYQFENNFSVQAAYTLSDYRAIVDNYVDPDRSVPLSAFQSDQEISVSRLMLGLTYRF